jgi:hypothetical protein
MRHSLSLALLFLTLSLPSYARDFVSRMQKTYLATDKNYELNCEYTYNKSFQLISPKSETIKGEKYLKREFVIENATRSVPMVFIVEEDGRALRYSLTFDGKYVSQGKLAFRELQINPVNDADFALEFETSKIHCQVNFAYAYPVVIRDGNYHINVHPHIVYDWQSLLKEKTESYLNNPEYKSLILLETGNNRGNLVNIWDFFGGVNYMLPQMDYPSDLTEVPSEVELIVSPAGNSRYIIDAQKEVNVTYTGGNHNYCIWNSTRWILQGLMKSKASARINFYYDTNAIVAQKRGIERMGMDFPRRDVNRSNLLKDLLTNKRISEKYHINYYNYFGNILLQRYPGMYKSIKLNYKAPGYEKSDTILGNGSRELEVSLIYL